MTVVARQGIHICNLSTQNAEAERYWVQASLICITDLRSAWSHKTHSTNKATKNYFKGTDEAENYLTQTPIMVPS